MTQPTSPFVNSIRRMATNSAQVLKSLPAAPSTAIPQTAGVSVGQNKKRSNPFLSATDTDSAEFREMYGVNRPLAKPMFLGYKDDQAIYGGSRLFILY